MYCDQQETEKMSLMQKIKFDLIKPVSSCDRGSQNRKSCRKNSNHVPSSHFFPKATVVSGQKRNLDLN